MRDPDGPAKRTFARRKTSPFPDSLLEYIKARFAWSPRRSELRRPRMLGQTSQNIWGTGRRQRAADDRQSKNPRSSSTQGRSKASPRSSGDDLSPELPAERE